MNDEGRTHTITRTPRQPEEKVAPKWGDPLSSIPADRQAELHRLADAQRAWVASAPDGRRDFKQSAFRDVDLTGAEVFFLAAAALAGPGGDVEEQATHLRAAKQDPAFPWMELSAIHLEGASLDRAHLEDAALRGAHLERANLLMAHLAGAVLVFTHLEDTVLSEAHLERANLLEVRMERAALSGADLTDANLTLAHLEGALLRDAHLERAVLDQAHLPGADLRAAHLTGATLADADLTGATLDGAHLETLYVNPPSRRK